VDFSTVEPSPVDSSPVDPSPVDPSPVDPSPVDAITVKIRSPIQLEDETQNDECCPPAPRKKPCFRPKVNGCARILFADEDNFSLPLEDENSAASSLEKIKEMVKMVNDFRSDSLFRPLVRNTARFKF
jgi:hypothetical protein